MKIENRVVGDVHVLDCSGKITLGEGTMAIRNTVREVLKNGGKKIVLNLADVLPSRWYFAGSAMLGAAANAALVGAGAAGAISYEDRRTTGVQVDDEGIELRVGNRISERYGDKVHVNVTSFNRGVLLKDLIAQGADAIGDATQAHQLRVVGRGQGIFLGGGLEHLAVLLARRVFHLGGGNQLCEGRRFACLDIDALARAQRHRLAEGQGRRLGRVGGRAGGRLTDRGAQAVGAEEAFESRALGDSGRKRRAAHDEDDREEEESVHGAVEY